jgi:hypothetical protein
MSPRSYGRYGSDSDSRGGHAVSRGTASEMARLRLAA